MDRTEASYLSWPLTSDEAKQALEGITDLLFEPVLRTTLIEWGKLRQRCKLKALKRQSLGRIAGKLHSAGTCEEMVERFEQASPEEAFALLQSLASLKHSECPNLAVMAAYRDEADYRHRWIATVVNKSLEWAQSQRSLFETDDWLRYKD